MARKRVLWVDDDLLFYRSYHAELSELYKIDIAKAPDAMWSMLKEHPANYYGGIILDVLLPYGAMGIEETNGGLRTGLALLEMLRKSEYSKIPIIIFSIRETKDVDDVGVQYRVPVLRKSEVRISEFIDAAKKEFGV